ncbi:MAG: nitroreductase family protein [Anaerolineae bacterium]|nr:nitroreductase family protein [Anaerolineae bacterium]
MIHNPVIDTLMKRKSVRTFTGEVPNEDVIETIIRAGQQAPFAYQLGDMILDRGPNNRMDAPLQFTICYDIHRMALVAQKRGWEIEVDDMQLLIFGVQDAAYMAQNMVIAAESLGLASCYIGMTPFIAPGIKKKYKLPDRVFPVVTLVMGYPDEWEDQFPPRPRYPIEFSCFEGEYPQMDDTLVEKAMQVMDEGYLAQGYYEKQNAMIDLHGVKEETFTFDNYSWTEHISRKCALYTDAHLRTAYEKIGFRVPEE